MGALKKKKSKIIITGANGQLGRCLQDVSRTYPNYDFHFKNSKQLDITSKEQIDILFAQEEFDYCINCAAYTAVDKAETDQENAFLVNAEAVKYLAEACKAQNSILIHISTDFVFDGTKTTPYVEEDIPNPINVYGASKLKGEQYVQDILEQFFIIRTSWVYSEYGNNFVKTMLRLAKERKELSVVVDQFGSPTYAGDLANVIMKIISIKSNNYGLYNYSNEGGISWYEFARVIIELKGLKIKVNAINTSQYPTLAVRPKRSTLKITEVLNLVENCIIDWKWSLKQCLKNL
tara:strand:+ start:19299 stop:20171 length:873 start_codon:yes stop_codon:yes gene_type:complete